jgi:Holliday junction resolvase
MGGRTSRNKGAGAERELATTLTEELGFCVKRKLSQARDSGDDIQIGKYRIEVKRREKLAIMDWCRQVEACTAASEVPLVAFRQNGQPWRVVIKLEHLIPLLREDVAAMAETLLPPSDA